MAHQDRSYLKGIIETTESDIRGADSDTLKILKTNVDKIPLSDGTVTWNATALASINAEVDTALNTAVPASPTADSLNDIMSKAAGGNAFDKATDSLEMISDKVGAYAGTSGAGATESVKAELDLVKAKTDTIVVSVIGTTTAGTIVQDTTTGTPDIVNVTTSASANTFGSWATIDASAAADVWISHVTITPRMGTTATVTFTYCVEIGTGAAPVAKIRFSGYVEQVSTAGIIGSMVFSLSIPIKVASGTAISARASDSGTDDIIFAVGVSYYLGLET